MNNTWFIYSLSALTCLSAMSFLITVLAKKGLPVSFILLGIGVIFVVYYSVQTFYFGNQKFEITIGNIALLLVIGLLSALGNYLLYQAAAIAPNAGLALAVAGMQSSVVAFLAFLIFKNNLTPLQIVGLVFAVIAIFLINIGSSQSTTSGDEKVISSKAKLQ